MAQNTTITLPAGVWTELTNSNISGATFQNNGGNAVFIAGTAGAVAPTDKLGSIRYNPGTGERSTVALADLFPGIAATRLYALAEKSGGQVFISHA